MKKLSIYEEVTNQIIAAMEQGTDRWFAPWDSAGAHHNGVTKHEYSGINILLTYFATMENGFTSSEWFTFNQAKKLEGKIKKGSKATKIVAYSVNKYDADGKKLPEDTPDEEVHKVIPFAKAIPVFNRDQIEGLPETECNSDKSNVLVDADISSKLNKYLATEGIELTLKGDSAYYNRAKDAIVLPELTRFHSSEGYFATLFHEAAHSTGHENRLNRVFGKFKSPEYAFEELVAELAASFMCSKLGISGQIEDHASYLSSWIKLLKEDNKAIFKASALAEKATKYVFNSFSEDKAKVAA